MNAEDMNAEDMNAEDMNTAELSTVSSSDGTTIAYDQQGEGPALILVDGALTVHSSGSGSKLAGLLA
ncbi:MAG: hypothetical protein ACRDPO_01975, partial [Streptosporangiaceae bacterium]